jgi:hypothetical protein
LEEYPVETHEPASFVQEKDVLDNDSRQDFSATNSPGTYDTGGFEAVKAVARSSPNAAEQNDQGSQKSSGTDAKIQRERHPPKYL